MPERGDLLHAAIGGGICFLTMAVLVDIGQIALEQILSTLGIAGVMVFHDQILIAKAIFTFGLIFLTSGFLGGLYVGYQTDENLRTILAIPGVIGFVALTVLIAVLGNPSVFYSDILGRIVFPLFGNIVGSYLGGYTLNWSTEEEEEEELPSTQKLSLDLGK